MRSRLPKSAFFAKMKKPPELQAVLDNLQNMTVEEIQALVGPHFPKWIRDHLVELKQNNGVDKRESALRNAQNFAQIMIDASRKSD